MGDRAYMEIVCRRTDALLFEELGFYEEEWCHPSGDLPAQLTFLVDPEANYAHDDDLLRLAENCVPFCGRHDQGSTYDAAVVASNGVSYGYALTVFSDGRPYAGVEPDGMIDEEQLYAATQYYKIEAAARLALGVTERLFSG